MALERFSRYRKRAHALPIPRYMPRVQSPPQNFAQELADFFKLAMPAITDEEENIMQLHLVNGSIDTSHIVADTEQDAEGRRILRFDTLGTGPTYTLNDEEEEIYSEYLKGPASPVLNDPPPDF